MKTDPDDAVASHRHAARAGYEQPLASQPTHRHADLELAKWVAILTMTIDHYGKIVDPAVYAITNDIGRMTFPLFAWIIGSRLAMQPSLGRGYLQSLVIWALVSQPVFVFVGKSWTEPNILVTLALGVAAHVAAGDWLSDRRLQAGWSLAAIASVSLFVDYGFFGVFAIVLIARVAAPVRLAGAWLAGPLGVLANISVWVPHVGPGAIWALLATPMALASVWLRWALPRLPKQLFYAYYPLHLLVLHAASGVMR